MTARKPAELAVPSPPAVSPEDRDRLTSTGLTISEQALALRITCQAEYEAAGAFLTRVVRPALKQVDAVFDPIEADWAQAVAVVQQGLNNTKASHAETRRPFEDAKRFVDSIMLDWQRQERERALEEQRRVNRALQESAEAHAMDEATRLLEAGDEKGANTILMRLAGGDIRPVTALPPMTVRTPKADGVSVRTLKRFRVVDEAAIKREYLKRDDVKIQRTVTRLGKAAEEEVKGIEVFDHLSIASSAKEDE